MKQDWKNQQKRCNVIYNILQFFNIGGSLVSKRNCESAGGKNYISHIINK